MVARRIYVASSWRNEQQPEVVEALRAESHEVYDFRNPSPSDNGFRWSEMDPAWKQWTASEYAGKVVAHPVAQAGFRFDKAALDWCDTCILLLPSGRSAHLEAGYAAGQGKQVVVLLSDKGFEPELMYLLCDGLVLNLDDLCLYLRSFVRSCRAMDSVRLA